uniref:ubiquitinyl hydrolase 1 n=1 Tax=Magallana gigas TaxID=29159 RepID=A0A8W8JHC0_MAGGI
MGCIPVKEVLSVVAFLLSLASLLITCLKRKRKVNTKNNAVQSKQRKKEIAVQNTKSKEDNVKITSITQEKEIAVRYTKSKEDHVKVTSITQEAKTSDKASSKPNPKAIDITSFKPKKNKNLGNTCYFNAALQALNFTKSFRESLQCLQSSSVNAQDLLLSKTVYDLMRGAERNEDNSKELKNVFKAIKNIYRNDPFVIGKQEDSHELLNTLLVGIFDEIKTLIKNMPNRRKDPDWIDARRIFTGCFIIMYVYDSCEDNVPRNELQTISLISPQEGVEEGLFDLERVEEDEEFDLPCRICKTVGSGRAYRRLLVFQPPPVLVLHIDRFKMDDSRGLTKNTKLVKYPKCLNMAKFCSAVGKERLQNRSLYELYAVIVHKAPNCTNLDVSSQTKSKRADVDADWFIVSDEFVSKVSEKDVLNHPNAYILFYEVQ